MMDGRLGTLLTVWTIRAAVACYLLRVAVDLTTSNSLPGQRVTRGAWTLGLGFYLAHVLAAFHFYHQWSHTRAYQHTAHVTERVVGVDWGGGLYFNYLFTLLWIADVLAWWLTDIETRRRSRQQFWSIHLIFAFMMLNATVVFGSRHWVWIALGFGLTVYVARCILRRRSHNPAGGT